MSRFSYLALATLLVACGGASPSTDGLRDAQRLSAEMGEVETEARVLTTGLTTALESGTTPDQSLSALARYIEGSIDRMREVSVEIAARFEALEEPEYTSYHQVFADSMADATFGWLDACVAFIEAHPDHEQELRDTVAPLGPLRIPDTDEDDE